MSLQITPDDFLRLADINGKNNQSLTGKLAFDVIHGSLVAAAVRTPCRPELQQNGPSAKGGIANSLAVKRLRRKLRSPRSGVSPRQHAENHQGHQAEQDVSNAGAFHDPPHLRGRISE